MKKIILSICSLFILFYGCLFACDISVNHHLIKNHLSITNASAFPNYALIHYQVAVWGVQNPQDEYVEIIDDNTILKQQVPYNSNFILAIPKPLFEQYGGIEHIDFESLVANCEPIFQNYPSITDCAQADNNCSMQAETYYYEIQSINDNNMTSKLMKRVIEYSDREDQTLFYQ